MNYRLPRAVNGHAAFEEHGEPDAAADTAMLEAVRRTAADLLAKSPQPPSTLNVRAGGISVEMAWQAVTEAAQPAAGPAAAGPVPLTPVPTAPAGETVKAATVGVFYRAPSPGAPPFVSEGDEIAPGQQVAIIEAMKLMLPVEADRGGRIAEVLVGDGEAVEFGQPLFRLAAADEITEITDQAA
jgi:acetyl-CoA carboxylase biotin carboxyl carrier protein